MKQSQNTNTLEAKIKETLHGIYKIEESGDGVHVYTENCFCDTNRLKEWLNTFSPFGIVNIEIGYRFDRTHGLVYTLQREEQIGK